MSNNGKVFSFKADENLANKIDKAVRNNGSNQSEIIRRALDSYFSTGQKPLKSLIGTGKKVNNKEEESSDVKIENVDIKGDIRLQTINNLKDSFSINIMS